MTRHVVCLHGLPFDVVSLNEALAVLCHAINTHQKVFLSTPNLNFLIASLSDEVFRRSVIDSDLSVADGMPIVWLSRLLGLPIHERVAGSDLFEALRNGAGHELLKRPVSVYFLGGPPGVAEKAAEVINAEGCHMICAGFHCPGFGSVAEMSSPDVIEAINASGADFLMVALGAKKGQEWIVHNLPRLTVPVVGHLGAVVNFVAGTVSRAPVLWRRLGLEWLWRIKEEPLLFRRYWLDAQGFFRLLIFRVVPLAWMNFRRPVGRGSVQCVDGRFLFSGCLRVEEASLFKALWSEIADSRSILFDFSAATYVGPEFLGNLLLFEKFLHERQIEFKVAAVSPAIARLFQLNGLENWAV